KIFDYGIAGFAPKVVLAPGKIVILSEERPDSVRTVFHIRTFLTRPGEWLDNILEKNTRIETVTYPVVTTAGDTALLFWVSTTVDGFDVMSSELKAEQKEWSTPKPIYRSPAPPEALTASGRGNLIALGWSLRGGPKNSILIQMVSRDGGNTWRAPGVLYSVAANAGLIMSVVSATDIAAFIDVMDDKSERLRFKYSVNAGETWVPGREIDAVELGPGKAAKESRRLSFTTFGDRSVAVAWEEWRDVEVTLVFRTAPLPALANAPARPIPQPAVADRFSYYPQVWSAGRKLLFTYGNKRKLKVVTEQNVSANDLYLVEASATRPARPKAAPTRSKKPQ
ncbi:MAG TPA: sialidase family protein, partial [Acidobacteriota bacterium]